MAGSRSVTQAAGSSPASPAEPGDAAFSLALVGFTTLGLLLRLAGAVNDLWFDEIVTYNLAGELRWPWEVVAADRFLVDNNHPLNTLLVAAGRAVGLTDWALRVPHVIVASLTVPLMGLVARRLTGSVAAASIAMGWAAFSYMLVNSGSEARGYALMAPVALAATWVWLRGAPAEGAPSATASRWGGPGIYAALAAVGLLCHPIFVMLLLTLGLATPLWWWGRVPPREVVVETVRWHAAAAAITLAFAVGFVFRMEVLEQSTRGAYVEAFAAAAGTTLGAWPSERWMVPTLLLGVAAVVALVLWRGRAEPRRMMLLALGVVVVPAGFVLAVQPDFLYPRYLMVGSLFLILGWSWWLATLGRWRRPWGAVLACMLAVGPVVGQGAHLWQLMQHGRGGYRASLEAIALASDEPVITVAGDEDRPIRVLVEYHASGPVRGREIRFVPRQTDASGEPEPWSGEPVDWLIYHTPPPGRQVRGPGGAAYAFRVWMRTAPISGWHWFLAARVDSGPASGEED